MHHCTYIHAPIGKGNLEHSFSIPTIINMSSVAQSHSSSINGMIVKEKGLLVLREKTGIFIVI
jgi:hypothetical protein